MAVSRRAAQVCPARNRGQIILVDPASKLVMVHTAVRKKPSEPDSYAEIITLWLHVVAQLGK